MRSDTDQIWAVKRNRSKVHLSLAYPNRIIAAGPPPPRVITCIDETRKSGELFTALKRLMNLLSFSTHSPHWCLCPPTFFTPFIHTNLSLPLSLCSLNRVFIALLIKSPFIQFLHVNEPPQNSLIHSGRHLPHHPHCLRANESRGSNLDFSISAIASCVSTKMFYLEYCRIELNVRSSNWSKHTWGQCPSEDWSCSK